MSRDASNISAIESAKAALAESIRQAQSLAPVEAPLPPTEVVTVQQPAGVLSGEEKRAADARAAQSAMSRAGNALDAKMQSAQAVAESLENLTSRLQELQQAQHVQIDSEAIKQAMTDFLALEGSSLFAPILGAITEDMAQIRQALSGLSKTVQGIIDANLSALPVAKPNVEVLFEKYGKEVLDQLGKGGFFDAYLLTLGSAHRAGLEQMFDRVNEFPLADLTSELDAFVSWLSANHPGVIPGAAVAPAAPPAAPAAPPVLTPGTPDAVPAGARLAGTAVAPGGGTPILLLTQEQFDSYPHLMARAKTPEEKAKLKARYEATVRQMALAQQP